MLTSSKNVLGKRIYYSKILLTENVFPLIPTLIHPKARLQADEITSFFEQMYRYLAKYFYQSKLSTFKNHLHIFIIVTIEAKTALHSYVCEYKYDMSKLRYVVLTIVFPVM